MVLGGHVALAAGPYAGGIVVFTPLRLLQQNMLSLSSSCNRERKTRTALSMKRAAYRSQFLRRQHRVLTRTAVSGTFGKLVSLRSHATHIRFQKAHERALAPLCADGLCPSSETLTRQA